MLHPLRLAACRLRERRRGEASYAEAVLMFAGIQGRNGEGMVLAAKLQQRLLWKLPVCEMAACVSAGTHPAAFMLAIQRSVLWMRVGLCKQQLLLEYARLGLGCDAVRAEELHGEWRRRADVLESRGVSFVCPPGAAAVSLPRAAAEGAAGCGLCSWKLPARGKGKCLLLLSNQKRRGISWDGLNPSA